MQGGVEMRVFIESCHSALEYDQVQMFSVLGHEIAGHFDVGSKQRPKIAGITDTSLDPAVGLEGADLYIMHQVPSYIDRFRAACMQRGKRPVVLNCFGQTDKWQFEGVSDTLKTYPNGFVVAYSKREYNLFLAAGAPANKVRMIRFGKAVNEYQAFGGWNGDAQFAFVAGNSIHRRGEGCGWPILGRVLSESPHSLLISGKDTEELPNGLGELSFDTLRSMYRNARCFVSMGTCPAPYVLTLMEAMCSGCPVIAYNNGWGIRDEGFDIIVVDSPYLLSYYINQLIKDKAFAQYWSQKVKTSAMRNFEMGKVAMDWANFLNDEVMK
jgi:hypothetical protein